ncbi:SusE outer membrane protein [Mesonia phycicola]|uniref:SusE outer membrane protein n=1 Tax=Mesonia phycicola TaxID=579105 RepID=A0A1M6DV88_9FLAO|nr:SusF/SusE family outer membrane protein [Mesonia phycicola]SHI77085.1 SusE outer membrane protein [Mesonia phycicola]
MKKLIYIVAICTLALGFNACEEEDEFTFIASASNTADFLFTNSVAETYSLSALVADNPAERFVWNEADFDVETPVNYELQGATTETFDIYTTLADVTETNYSVTVSSMMTLATEAGLDNDPETEAPNSGMLYFRVRAYVGADAGNVVEQFSDMLTLNVELVENTSEEPLPQFPNLFLVGNATAAGWDNNNLNYPLVRDPENENQFSYTGKFLTGDEVGFKMLETKGAWHPQWGQLANILSSSTPEGENEPDSFTVDTEGYYTVTIDKDENTYEITSYDESSATSYGSIGFIGSAITGDDTGWNDDVDMTQSTFDPHIWYATEVSLFDGELKFRADNSWDDNWGGTTEFSGYGVFNSANNIPVSEATYDIWLNDLNGNYILIPVEE